MGVHKGAYKGQKRVGRGLYRFFTLTFGVDKSLRCAIEWYRRENNLSFSGAVRELLMNGLLYWNPKYIAKYWGLAEEGAWGKCGGSQRRAHVYFPNAVRFEIADKITRLEHSMKIPRMEIIRRLIRCAVARAYEECSTRSKSLS